MSTESMHHGKKLFQKRSILGTFQTAVYVIAVAQLRTTIQDTLTPGGTLVASQVSERVWLTAVFCCSLQDRKGGVPGGADTGVVLPFRTETCARGGSWGSEGCLSAFERQ